MKHLVKVPLQMSDLFVGNVNVDKETITYQVRNREDGKLMEPNRESKFEVHDGVAYFDKRHIDMGLLKHVAILLES